MAKLLVKEKTIEKQILHYFRSRGIFCWKAETQGTWNAKRGRYLKDPTKMKGVSDILGFIPLAWDQVYQPRHRFFAIEVKSKTGRLTPEQKKFQDQIKEFGHIAFVARSIEDVERELGLS